MKVVRCVSTEAQDEKVRWNTTNKKTTQQTKKKTPMGVIFNLQSSQLLTWSLPIEEIFQVRGQNPPVENLAVVDFRS